ncbi:MAG: phosphodiesterase [Roseivivax sp.]|nr:phosphodiesterase [Roseivivax sp.]
MTLPRAFLDRPIAHRALHDKAAGRPENSRAAVRAAVQQGYGIEIDLQLSRDGQAMVFHDYDLKRLTGTPGALAQRDAAELSSLPLAGGDEGIPTLAEVLSDIGGQVALLIEIKDQHGGMGVPDGRLEAATAAALAGYRGPVAVMSFNPHSIEHMARLAPDLPRGLTTDRFTAQDWPTLSAGRRAELRAIPDAAATGASFISHGWRHLDMPRVAELKAQGLSVLCWTIRSPEQEAQARRVAQNITFEGYAA